MYFTVEGTETILYLVHRTILYNGIAKTVIMLFNNSITERLNSTRGTCTQDLESDRPKNNSLLLDELSKHHKLQQTDDIYSTYILNQKVLEQEV